MNHEKFSDKKLILSEACIEYSKFSAGDYLKNAQKYAHDMIGNMNNGIYAILLNREPFGLGYPVIQMNWGQQHF